jgi:hypothetical protein
MPLRRTASIVDHFASLDDPRRNRQKQHKLIDILVIAICAVLGGANDWVAVESFGYAKQAITPRNHRLPPFALLGQELGY